MPRPPSDANVRAIEAVDAMQKEMPKSLAKLLEKEGIIVAAMPDRVASKKAIENRLADLGVLNQAKEWKVDFTRQVKLCLPGKSWNIAREVYWRVVELKAAASLDDWLTAANIGTSDSTPVDPAVQRLPQDIRWVYLHPMMAGKASASLRSAGKEYEASNPCPNNGARNRLNSASRSDKSRDDFFKHVDKLMMGMNRTRNGPVASHGAAEAREVEAMADLESRLFGQNESFGGETDMDGGSD